MCWQTGPRRAGGAECLRHDIRRRTATGRGPGGAGQREALSDRRLGVTDEFLSAAVDASCPFFLSVQDFMAMSFVISLFHSRAGKKSRSGRDGLRVVIH